MEKQEKFYSFWLKLILLVFLIFSFGEQFWKTCPNKEFLSWDGSSRFVRSLLNVEAIQTGNLLKLLFLQLESPTWPFLPSFLTSFFQIFFQGNRIVELSIGIFSYSFLLMYFLFKRSSPIGFAVVLLFLPYYTFVFSSMLEIGGGLLFLLSTIFLQEFFQSDENQESKFSKLAISFYLLGFWKYPYGFLFLGFGLGVFFLKFLQLSFQAKESNLQTETNAEIETQIEKRKQLIQKGKRIFQNILIPYSLFFLLNPDRIRSTLGTLQFFQTSGFFPGTGEFVPKNYFFYWEVLQKGFFENLGLVLLCICFLVAILSLWNSIQKRNLDLNSYLSLQILFLFSVFTFGTNNFQDRHIYILVPIIALLVENFWVSVVQTFQVNFPKQNFKWLRVSSQIFLGFFVWVPFFFVPQLVRSADFCFAGFNSDVRDLPHWMEAELERRIIVPSVFQNSLPKVHVNRGEMEGILHAIALRNHVKIQFDTKRFQDWNPGYQYIEIGNTCRGFETAELDTAQKKNLELEQKQTIIKEKQPNSLEEKVSQHWKPKNSIQIQNPKPNEWGCIKIISSPIRW